MPPQPDLCLAWRGNAEPRYVGTGRAAPGTGVTCLASFGRAGSTAPGLTMSQTLTYGVAADKADEANALKKYGDAIDCDGDPVRIN